MNNYKILLAEDDKNLGEILKEFLLLKGYLVDLCDNGEKALIQFGKLEYDLCLLDVMMPQKDGFTLAKELKKINKHIPVIFLTAKSLKEDIVSGFKLGADDYITKPFNTEELLLRIKAVLNRTNNLNYIQSSTHYRIGKYTFDYNSRKLKFNKETKVLTYKESELLKMLCEHSNDILKRESALKSIWKSDTYFNARSMDVYITKLRSYLKNDKSIQIENIHGIGFKLTTTK